MVVAASLWIVNVIVLDRQELIPYNTLRLFYWSSSTVLLYFVLLRVYAIISLLVALSHVVGALFNSLQLPDKVH